MFTAASGAYDVVVLGGGVAGSATALALSGRVRRLLVVESSEAPQARVGESIPPDARTVLSELGVWEAFRAQGHEPCLGSCSAWGEPALGYNDFLRHPLGHGWHLDRRRFDAWLCEQARSRGAELCRGVSYLGAEWSAEDGHRLRLRAAGGERIVRARFVVDATGRRAHFARSRGARRLLHDQLLCSAADFELPAERELGDFTWLVAVEYGWWYAARLPDRRVTAVVAVEPRALRRLGLHLQAPWLARLRAAPHLGALFAGLHPTSEAPSTWVAASCLLAPPAGQHWLAVGDAAACYDPISSLGIYKALADGLRAAPVICAALGGDPIPLQSYVRSAAVKFSEYSCHRQRFYATEQRWPDAEFWRRRREQIELVAERRRAPPTNAHPSEDRATLALR